MEKIVILTGAGISAESGLKTFRDSDGLWEGYNIEDVATPAAWRRNPALVQDFYNQRRKSVLEAKPNAAHYALAKLEEKYDVTIITQNIDDLHERGGSTKVVHLHGIITRSQSSLNANLTYPIQGWEIKKGRKVRIRLSITCPRSLVRRRRAHDRHGRPHLPGSGYFYFGGIIAGGVSCSRSCKLCAPENAKIYRRPQNSVYQ